MSMDDMSMDEMSEDEVREFYKLQEIYEKNDGLIDDLKQKRKQFAGIGTNKAKRRLNKLAANDPIAKAVRVALEIEDKSISAKDSYGDYKNKIYNRKDELISSLCKLFEERRWTYGIRKSAVPLESHVIYFEIPNCEQISWHFWPDPNSRFPEYEKEWDGKLNSTLGKLEAATIILLSGIEKK